MPAQKATYAPAADVVETCESGMLTDDDILKEFREHDNTLMEVDENDDNDDGDDDYDDDDDREVVQKKPTAAAASEAIDTLSSYGLLAALGADEIRRHLSHLTHIIARENTRILSQRQLAIDSFFP